MCFWYFMSEVKHSIIPVKSLYAMHDKHRLLPISRYLQKCTSCLHCAYENEPPQLQRNWIVLIKKHFTMIVN